MRMRECKCEFVRVRVCACTRARVCVCVAHMLLAFMSSYAENYDSGKLDSIETNLAGTQSHAHISVTQVHTQSRKYARYTLTCVFVWAHTYA
jgi:hypothetical protein